MTALSQFLRVQCADRMDSRWKIKLETEVVTSHSHSSIGNDPEIVHQGKIDSGAIAIVHRVPPPFSLF